MSLAQCQIKHRTPCTLKRQLISVTLFQSGILESGKRPTADRYFAEEEQSVKQIVRDEGMEKIFEQIHRQRHKISP